MYFIGTSARLQVPVRDHQAVYHQDTGRVVGTKRALGVQFVPLGGNVPDWAKDAVSQLAGFGRGCGLDEDPFTRCGQLDTDAAALEYGWDKEEKATVEAALLAQAGSGWVRADAPPLAAPWKGYDAIEGDGDEAARTIVELTAATGTSAKYVADYERQNKNRPEIIEVLDILAAEEADEVVAA